jgi:hypothetical protein
MTTMEQDQADSGHEAAKTGLRRMLARTACALGGHIWPDTIHRRRRGFPDPPASRNTEAVMTAYSADFAAVVARLARWSRACNNGHANPAWSTGEKLAVALVLDDGDTFAAEEYTPQEAAARIGGELEYYGYRGSVGEWIADIREAL